MHVAILLLLLIPASACAQSSKPQSKPVIGGQVSLPETADPIARKRPAIAEDASATSRLTGKINAARAMQYNREVVAFGPRPIGRLAHRKLESYLRSHLKGDTVEEDVFTADTPVGKFAMRNFIAKFPGTKIYVI